MPSPFPGMDPYLEEPAIWSGVHAALLGAMFEKLGPILRPKYAVRYEERVYVTSEEDPGYRVIVPDLKVVERDRPGPARQTTGGGAIVITEPVPVRLVDDEVHERSLVVIDIRDHSVVTIIEVLSPTNKMPNSFGRASFLKKRREIFAGDANWIEIDLLRAGERVSHLPDIAQTEYLVYLSRAGRPRAGFAWPISIRERLPVIAVPLRGNDPDVPLDLQSVLDLVVERGSYDLEAPVPPLSGDTAGWAMGITSQARPTE